MRPYTRAMLRAVRCYVAGVFLLLSIPVLALLAGPRVASAGCWLALIVWAVYLVIIGALALALIERGREWWAIGQALRRTEAERRNQWRHYLGGDE